jgi:ABC-type sugar transport system substrate-binding protein
MKLFKYIFILFSVSTLFILNNASAKDLKIAFFASSSENGYNQAIWEGVKAAATEAGAETAI